MFDHFTLWGAFKAGGPVFYFLIVCSIVSFAAMIERFLYYRKKRDVTRESFMQAVKEQMGRGDIRSAHMTAKDTAAPFARVVDAGLGAVNQKIDEIAHAVERQILIEAMDLERRISIVGTIGSTAVYIGLLGTVWGIMGTFRDISKAGSGGIDVVIGGIAEALVCTAAGLFVAIPAVIAFNYFVKKIKAFVMDMELAASEIVDLIKRYKSQ